jgi:ParB/RepB/Spo0J family partition protein
MQSQIKVKLDQLEPNPFKPSSSIIEEHRVEFVIKTIQETGGYWDNILVRPHPKKKNKFQIICGHHRAEALKRLNITEFNVIKSEKSDIETILAMAGENANMELTPLVINETVLTVKTFLESKFKTYEVFEEYEKSELYKFLKGDSKEFEIIKKDGISLRHIFKMIGNTLDSSIKNYNNVGWSKSKISEALKELDPNDEVDTRVKKLLPNQRSIKEFRRIVKDRGISKKDQVKIINNIFKNGKPGSRQLADLVAEQINKRSSSKPFNYEDHNIHYLELLEISIRDVTTLNCSLNKIIDNIDVVNHERFRDLMFYLKRTFTKLIEAYNRENNRQEVDIKLIDY